VGEPVLFSLFNFGVNSNETSRMNDCIKVEFQNFDTKGYKIVIYCF